MNRETRGSRLTAGLLIAILVMAIFMNRFPANTKAEALSEQWTLVWSDEFVSGEVPIAPDPNHWGYEIGYVRNREWQYYTDSLQNAFCQNGYLHIEAHKESPGTYSIGQYAGQDGSISSASLISKDRVQYRYGRVEVRAKIDTDLGSWPAFWTLGINGEWPDCGECDIMEYYQGKLLFNTAWWLSGDARWTARWDSFVLKLSDLDPGWSTNFHVWAMEWTPAEVRLYMDDTLYNSWNTSADSGDSSIEGFQQPHYMIINQAIGGTAGGDATNLPFPTSYEVDYVRWYKSPENYADSETTTYGTRLGSLSQIKTSDNSYEAITELQVGGKPDSRYSRLEHIWTFNIGSENHPVLFVEAWHSANSENDDFEFSYSSDRINYTEALTVTKTVDDQTAALVALPEDLTGIVYIKVTDTDRSPGRNKLDTLYIDKLCLLTGSPIGVNNPPSFIVNPILANNATQDQPYSGSIAGLATDPEGDSISFSKQSGPAWLTVAADGTLSGTPGSSDIGPNSFIVEASDEQGATGQATLLITVLTTGQPTVSCADIALSYRKTGVVRTGLATVLIRDNNGATVASATVEGWWSGLTNSSASGVTAADGTVRLQSPACKSSGLMTFTITNIFKSGTIYDSNGNQESSDSITIP